MTKAVKPATELSEEEKSFLERMHLKIDGKKTMDEENKDYSFDLFIAYFCGGDDRTDSTADAEELFLQIEGSEGNQADHSGMFPGKYKIFYYPITHKNRDFDSTAYLVARKSKAFLLVGRKPSAPIDLSKTHKALGEEINAVWDNPFMKYAKDHKKVSPARIYAADDPKDKCKTESKFEMKDLVHSAWKGEEGEEKDLHAHCPFFGSDTFSRTDDGLPPAKKVAEWLDKVIEAFSCSNYCSPDVTVGNLPLQKTKLYWVGTRQSDADQCGDLFAGTVCLFGDNSHGKKDKKKRYSYCAEIDGRIDHNVIDEASDRYIFETVMEIAQADPKARFYCYNQSIVYNTFDDEGKNLYERLIPGTDEQLLNRFICLNDKTVLKTYASKENFRKLCKETAGKEESYTLPCISVTKSDCSYHKLMMRFTEQFNRENKGRTVPENARFVIQAPTGSGGETTYVLGRGVRQRMDLEAKLNDSTTYTATIYQENNVPVNVHALIFNNNVVWLSPPSIQLICHTEQRLMYRGADFIECRNIPAPFLQVFMDRARAVCEALSIKGYVGVCGVDGILCDMKEPGAAEHPEEHVFLMELNTRFQASTGLLNRGLREGNYPSLQHLNLYAFYSAPSLLSNNGARELGNKSKDCGVLDGGRLFANLSVPYANMSYVNCSARQQATHLLRFADDTDASKKVRETNLIVDYELDALDARRFIRPCAPKEEGGNPVKSYRDRCSANAYLYRIVFKTNLCWVNNASSLYFNENLMDEDPQNVELILANYHLSDEERIERMLRTKVALLIQGVNFTPEALNAFRRPGTFQSVDIVFKSKEHFDNYVVNAPVVFPKNPDEGRGDLPDEKKVNKKPVEKEKQDNSGIKFTQLTPFLIDENGAGGLALYYYDNKVDDIELMPEDELWKQQPKNLDVPVKELAYLSTDRLRVHLTNACKFKRHDAGCKFCGISCGNKDCLAQDKATFTPENVKKVVGYYVEHYRDKYFTGKDEKGREVKYFPLLRHFLVGGQTADLAADGVADRLIQTVGTIYRTTRGMSEIYAMIVPCNSITVERMKNAGLTHLAFNMEVWDDDIAEKIMPGKRSKDTGFGGNDRAGYIASLKIARKVLDRHESVRSMLLIGLEPLENTLEGIRALLEIDVQPMLSIFRPMPGTPYADAMSPRISDVVDLYYKAAELCRKKEYFNTRGIRIQRSMHLGPDCKCCQNNTVALPYREKEEEQKKEEQNRRTNK